MEPLFYRSLGLELSGPRSQRTALAILDHYPEQGRIVLQDLVQPEKSSDDSDIALGEYISKIEKGISGIGIHAPVSLPPIVYRAHKNLSKVQQMNLSEVKWMEKVWSKLKNKPHKFIPYLHRPAEVWLRHKAVERYSDVMSFATTGAPLAARVVHLKGQIKSPLNEIFPRAVIKRISESLEIRPRVFKSYTDLEGGVKAREEFLIQLSIKLPQLFLYEKDVEKMILSPHQLNAFLCALMQHMVKCGEFEGRPKGFPKAASWIHIPRIHIDWDKLI